jgi:hypothetical protein
MIREDGGVFVFGVRKMEWLPAIQNFGFPAVVLAAVGVALWQVLKWVARIAERVYCEVIKPVAEKHFLFLDAATEAQREFVVAISGAKADIGGVKQDTEEILGHLKGKQ